MKFHPESMSKVQVVAPKSTMQNIVDTMHKQGVIHIEPHTKTEELDIGSPLAHGEKLAEILVKIRGVISYLEIKRNSESSDGTITQKDYYELGKKTHQLYDTVVKLIEERKISEEQLNKIEEQLKLLSILSSLKLTPSVLNKSKRLEVFIGTIEKADQLEESLKKNTSKFMLRNSSKEKRQYIVCAVEKENANTTRDLLNTSGFIEVDMSLIIEDIETPLTKKKVMEQSKKLTEKIKIVTKKLLDIKKKQTSFLTKNENLLKQETEKSEAPLKFGVTKSSFSVSGWVPTKSIQELQKELNDVAKNKIYFESRKANDKENPPIKLKHNKIIKPFEFLIDLYELPILKEIDPTALLFFTFPLFFAIMLGDFGYGITLFALFYWLKKKIPAGKSIFTILMYSAALSAVFGIIYGEYFGFEFVSKQIGETLCNSGVCLHKETIIREGSNLVVYEFPRILSRATSTINIFGTEMLSVLVIGAIIGFIHVNFGLLIGFYNEWKSHGFYHAFLEKISWIILQLGLILVVLSMAKIIYAPPTVGWIVTGAAIVAIYLGEGIKGLIELPAIFTNILSYMRLGAVGLASVGLAVVVNENLALPMMQSGILGFIGGTIVFILGHGINMILGVIGPFLHSLRLHYVEFFSKFYHGGGIRYSPFGKND